MAKQNKTICLELDTIKKGKKQSTEKGFKSFSEYVGHLIIKDEKPL